MARSVRTNYLYNLIYQITAILLPLITMPYVSRVLGPQGVGTNSLTNANTQYFMLLGTLGITMYATKKIATVRENRRKLRQTFWEIFSIQFIGCMISYIIFVLVLGIRSSLGLYYMLQGFFILSSAIDISWYFVGIEDFKNASIRSFLVKIISVFLIFIFVKDSNDLWQYILINSLTMFIGQFVMWIYVDKSTFSFKSLDKLKLRRHITPILVLFIPQVATQIYTVLDKTMLGVFSPTVEVGYYDQSQKIVRILLTILTSLGTVMMPRIASLISKNQHDIVKNTLKKSFTIISFLAIPIAFGIMGVSDRFIPMFFGYEYLSVIPLLKISSILVIIIGVGNVFGTQYMIAVGKNKEYTISVCVGAAVNFILNLILIPKFSALGAVIATVSAEFSIALIQLWYSREIVDISWIKETYKYWISGIVMLIIVSFLGEGTYRNIFILARQIIIGSIVYFGILILLKDNIIKNFFNLLKSKLKKTIN
ncbi:flippase [Clostridium sp.]|uniref:flippase n=2 Tax=Clostridium TaxID=1485 RepID=UPI0025BB86DF|nr:flippase [Clostridium sp.]MCI9303186.1 flippase [Clostridium sp.]